MKKYKLRTNSFKGFNFREIVFPLNDGNQYGKENSNIGDECIGAVFIEKMPELFEEVEEPYYKIISFVNRFNRNVIEINPLLDYESQLLENILGESGHSLDIYSIQRIEDEEIFQLGDFCDLRGRKSQIDKFDTDESNENNIFAMSENFGESIKTLKKSKQIIFTTSDGKHIYLRQRYIFVHKETFRLRRHKCQLVSGRDKSLVYFANRDLARDYVSNHAPMYSLNDIENCFGKTATKLPLFSAFISKLNKSITKPNEPNYE